MATSTNKVGLTFTADTGAARREVEKLRKTNEKLASSTVKGGDRQIASLDAQIATWGKMAAGIGVAIAAVEGMKAATERYAKISQLRTAAVGANIDAIQDASRGLLTQYESLQFAAAALNTDFKLSQKEMEEVAKFMIVLRNQGNDLDEVYKEVTKSLVEGNVEGMKKFGIVIQGVTPGLKSVEALMGRIAAENKKAGDNISVAGDNAKRAGVEWSDAVDKLVFQLGRLGDALAPLLGIISGIASKIAEIFEETSDEEMLARWGGAGAFGVDLTRGMVTERGLNAQIAEARASLLAREAAASTRGLSQSEVDSILDQYKDLGRVLVHSARWGGIRFLEGMTDWMAKSPEAKEHIWQYANLEAESRLAATKALAQQRERAAAEEAARQAAIMGGQTAVGAQGVAGVPRVYGSGSLLGAGTAGAGDPFGPGFKQAEIQQRMAAATEWFNSLTNGAFTAADAMGMLHNASAAAFEAFVTGSGSAEKAFKKAMAGMLLAQGSQMFGIAITEGVHALVSLAMWDLEGAGRHAVAAAKAAAGAAALGALARGLGVGAPGGGGGALPAAAGGAVGGGVAGAVGSNVTIFVGSDFEDNARSNAQRLRRAFGRASEMGGTSTAVVNG